MAQGKGAQPACSQLNTLKSAPTSWLKWFSETPWSGPKHCLYEVYSRVVNTEKIGRRCTRSICEHTRYFSDCVLPREGPHCRSDNLSLFFSESASIN